jgi:hypothetical protein
MNHEHYNYPPIELTEIGEQNFWHGMMMYIITKPDQKQVCREVTKPYKLQMFPLAYNNGLGYAVKEMRTAHKSTFTYHRYGGEDKWKTFQGNFAAQFAGDNS